MDIIQPNAPAAAVSDAVPAAAKDAGQQPRLPQMPQAAKPLRAPAPMDQNDPRRYIGVLLSFWWVILLTSLLGTATGAAYCILATPMYRAICRYEIELGGSDSGKQQAFDAEGLVQASARQRMVLNSSRLRGLVRAKLQPKWSGVINSLDVKVAIRADKELPNIFDVTVDGVSGEYALDYLKEMLSQFQEIQRSRSLEANENSLRYLWLEKQKLAQEQEDAQNTLVKFQKENNIQFNEAKQIYDEQFLTGLVQRQNTLRTERTMLESQFPSLENASANTIQNALQLTEETHQATSGIPGAAPIYAPSPTTGPGTGQATNTAGPRAAPMTPVGGGFAAGGENQAWQNLDEYIARAEAEYQDLLATYKPSHPAMREMKRQIEAAKRNLRFAADSSLKQLRSRFDALKIQESALDNSARSFRGELNLSVSQRATYESLKAKVAHLTQLHDQVFTHIIESTAKSTDATFSYMLEQPVILNGAVWPDPVKIMAVAILASICLGIGFVFLIDFFDTSLLDILAIEEKLGLYYLSSIPNWERLIPNLNMKNAQVVVRRDKSNIPSEVYRSLRTVLDQIIAGRHGYALAVTSTEANEGKSLTAINLAVTYAWSNRKILLVDGDLRRGKLHSPFGIESKVGFTDILLGRITDWREVVFPTSYENLFLLPSGKYNHSAPELLDPARVRALINEWGKEYDLIIFDTAPVGRVVDGALIARACDGTILITRQHFSSFSGVRHATHRLEGSNLIGFCLNGIEIAGKQMGYFNYRNSGRYGHYAHYNYYDRYKYGQYGYGAPAGTPVQVPGEGGETAPAAPVADAVAATDAGTTKKAAKT